MTDKNQMWAVFGNFRSQSNSVSVWGTDVWYLGAFFSAVLGMQVLDDCACGLNL